MKPSQLELVQRKHAIERELRELEQRPSRLATLRAALEVTTEHAQGLSANVEVGIA